MAKSYEIDACSGSVIKKLLLFTLPLMFTGLLQLLFNAADIIVVGKFSGANGDNCMGAVGANTSLINLLTNLFMGLAVGANVLASKAHGAGHKKELSEIVHTSLLLGFFSGLLLSVVGFIFADKLLILMKTPDGILPLAVTYLRIYFIGMPGMMIYNFGAAILRSVGDTKRPLYYLLISGAVNVVLNLVFVIVFKMDVAGVATSTVISEYISVFLIIRCLLREQSSIRLEPKKLRIHGKQLLEILKVGLPAGFQGVVFSLSNVVIQSSVNLFGDTVVSGNSAAASIEGFVYMAMNSFYQAAISFTGQNYGAKKLDRIPKILFSALGCVFATGLVFGWFAYLLGSPLLSIYSNSADVIAAGLIRMRYILTSYFLCGMMDVMVGMLRGLGCSVTPMIVSLAGACGLRILWISTVFQVEKYHQIETVYISYPITWAITFAAHVVCFAVIWHRVKKKEALRVEQ